VIRTLLHGFAQAPESWGALRRPGDHAPRLPGHGSDPEPVPSFDQLADRLATQLPHGSHLVGYSLGGRLALAVAVREPSRIARLTIVSAHAGIADADARRQRADADETLAKSIEAHGMSWFVHHWESLPMWASQRSLDDDALATQRAIRQSHTAHGLSAVLRKLGPGSMPDLRSELASLRMPVDLVVGALDAHYANEARTMVHWLPQAVVHVLDGVGHNVLLEAPHALASVLEEQPASEVLA